MRTNPFPTSSPISGLPHPAVVRRVVGPRVVELEAGGEATLALAGDYRPAVGDTLLVIDGAERAWAIGVVSSLRVVEAHPSAVRADDGVEALVLDEGATLTVRDARGATLFTHDARTGQSRVHTSGDLTLTAPQGHLDLSAAKSVKVAAPTVELRAHAKPGTDDAPSTLRLGPDGAALESERLEVTAQRGRVAVEDATFASNRLETAVKKARHIAGVVETRAERIVERARDVFREVDELNQVRAGRLRMVARGTWSVLSKRTTLKAEDDLALLGDKIHLA